MKQLKPVILSLSLSLIITCSPFDKTSRSVKKENHQLLKDSHSTSLWTANSHDTIFNFYLVVYTNNYFILISSDYPKKRPQQFYAGQYKTDADTMLLSFSKNHLPLHMANYFIKDPSGQFLIYPYRNNSRQVYLAIQYLKK